MGFEIEDHKLKGVTFQPTKKMGGRIIPKLITNHYTAGSTFEGDFNTLFKRKNSVSAHLLVGRDAEVVQGVPFNRKAWHAGPSKYKHLKGINNHSIGIELQNMGYLKKVDQFTYTNWNGTIKYSYQDIMRKGWTLQKHRHSRIGGGVYYWIEYTDKQLQVLEEITTALIEHYETIEYIVSHEEIDTRGWKTDPGPAFPMDRYRHLLSRRTDYIGESTGYYEVNASKLNVRKGPGISHEVISQLSRNDMVMIIEGEEVEGWVQIKHGMTDIGWVYHKYIKPI